jgi:hypothetical protein
VLSLARALYADMPDEQVPAGPLTDNGGLEILRAPTAPDGAEWDDVEWMRGKTVLEVGDSISRRHILDSCTVSSASCASEIWRRVVRAGPDAQLLGQEATAVQPGDQYYPWDEHPVTIGDRLGLEEPSPASGFFGKPVRRSPAERGADANSTLTRRIVTAIDHGPYYCYLAPLDLMYVFTFNFGLDEFGYFSEQVSRVVQTR